VDDHVGRLLDYLEAEGLADNTVVVYTSDQGFFLGDHGWYDKRFMYEESLKMPFVIRYPAEVAPGSVNNDIVLNVDFAPLFLDLAGLPASARMQGRSFRPLLQGSTPPDWREAMYYRYWMNRSDHNVSAHYGIRTHKYKLIYYYYDGCGQKGANGGHCAGAGEIMAIDGLQPEWELFDLEEDPYELRNRATDPAYAGVFRELKDELHRIQAEVGDEPYELDRE
jgi:arylsulfatase A-like enzyme